MFLILFLLILTAKQKENQRTKVVTLNGYNNLKVKKPENRTIRGHRD